MSIFTEKELAKSLNLSYWTIRSWRIKENLPHIKIGRRIFYRPEAVQQWMKGMESLCKQETAFVSVV